MLTPFERALVAHLVADWLLQNDWMAKNKPSLTSSAAWLHFFIQFVFLSIALSLPAGLVLGIVHLIIDTRKPLNWWRRVFRQTTDGPLAVHMAIWSDQVLHVVIIAVWVALMT